jgi:uncharacterized protein YceK
MKKLLIMLIILALLQACGGRMSKKQNLDHTLYQYAKVMRWADFDQATNFIDPEADKDIKPSELELNRLKQFGVSSYVPRPILPGLDENSIIQTVELKLYNIHTKREKVVLDKQVWRYDEELKRWFLDSGLPKITH